MDYAYLLSSICLSTSLSSNWRSWNIEWRSSRLVIAFSLGLGSFETTVWRRLWAASRWHCNGCNCSQIRRILLGATRGPGVRLSRRANPHPHTAPPPFFLDGKPDMSQVRGKPSVEAQLGVRVPRRRRRQVSGSARLDARDLKLEVRSLGIRGTE